MPRIYSSSGEIRFKKDPSIIDYEAAYTTWCRLQLPGTESFSRPRVVAGSCLVIPSIIPVIRSGDPDLTTRNMWYVVVATLGLVKLL
ncbi:hypothetical protein JTE90_004584 [Oedothorax gibbosus]|uniref:Uncharacterized protein n=1 Tax=Oedothorax gibbosus TaxID=931172 RepID=A0AAV6UJF6_9ARAC|nr:hypothetical protein JTE90_004584 [Oedothorax gibbosus]